MVTITFACGHRLSSANAPDQAVCPTCGDRRVSRVKAPAPRFHGTVVGPCATYEDLPAVPVRLAKE
jgi:DNA-directed RNA polymerase subunit RPC12/RpoP